MKLFELVDEWENKEEKVDMAGDIAHILSHSPNLPRRKVVLVQIIQVERIELLWEVVVVVRRRRRRRVLVDLLHIHHIDV